MHPIHLRLLNQQLAAPQYSNPSDVVAHMGAIQAQEYRLMRWAVAMRTSNPSAEAFQKAFNDGRIIRIHLLRGTWQLVAAEDYAWMMSLCSEKARTTILGWMHSNHIILPNDEQRQVRDILERTVGDKGSVTKEDFAQALVANGIAMTDQRLSYHIRMGELNGYLVSGDLLPMKATYALTSAKVKASQPLTREESLALLARKYFQSHQPATLEDFIWWSGMNKGDCQRGMTLLGNELHTEHFGERTFYILDSCRTHGYRNGKTHLIPPYDEYLIGYKSRDLVLDPTHRHLAHNNSGIFNPIVAHNGIVCGNWSPFRKALEATFFPGMEPVSLQAAWEKYARFAGGKPFTKQPI